MVDICEELRKKTNILLSLALIPFFIPFFAIYKHIGVSVNYLFVCLGFLLSKKIHPPKKIILYIFLFYWLEFVITFFFIGIDPTLLNRKIISFFIFLSIFAFINLRFHRNDIEIFKLSIIILSVLYSLFSIVQFLSYQLKLGFNQELKGLIGSQRIAFLYFIPFFTMLENNIVNKIKFTPTQRILILAILFLGILLSFSRSIVFGLFLSLFLYFLLVGVKKLRWNISRKNLIVVIFSLAFLYFALSDLSKYFFEIFKTGFFEIFHLTTISGLTSAGFRYHLHLNVFHYLSSDFMHFIFGSGFLGVWILDPAEPASAHSQYLDILFRTGVLGFSVFMYMLLKIFLFLKDRHNDLFYSFFGLSVTGFFNETFKLSHGAFVLAFLIAITFNSQSYIKSNSLK